MRFLGLLLLAQLSLASPADSPWLQVVDNALTPELLAVFQERFSEINKAWRGTKPYTSSAQWIDARANDGGANPLEEPADILEAMVHALITAVPALQSEDWDVVELFGHERPQTRPQWFHFDAAEYEADPDRQGSLVRLPTYSAILYLADEEETHFGVFPNGLACDEVNNPNAATESKPAEPRPHEQPAEEGSLSAGGALSKGERLRCPVGGVQGFEPPHADYVPVEIPFATDNLRENTGGMLSERQLATFTLC